MCHKFCGAAEERPGQGWEVLDGRGGYGYGYGGTPPTCSALGVLESRAGGQHTP